jgi:hypothetical protein
MRKIQLHHPGASRRHKEWRLVKLLIIRTQTPQAREYSKQICKMLVSSPGPMWGFKPRTPMASTLESSLQVKNSSVKIPAWTKSPSDGS